MGRMREWVAAVVVAALPSLAFADSYQVTYGWDTPTWIPSDTPSYDAKYRLGGEAAVDLPDTTVPGGSFNYTDAAGTVLEMCPQNKNGALVTPSCALDQDGNPVDPNDWITVGGSPYPPTVPPMPAGFSATIIRTGS